jgi:hypothetical protein
MPTVLSPHLSKYFALLYLSGACVPIVTSTPVRLAPMDKLGAVRACTRPTMAVPKGIMASD